MTLKAIGKWEGNFAEALALITPYHTELRVWICAANGRLCLEEVSEELDVDWKPKSLWFHSVRKGGDILIPDKYEQSNRTIHDLAPGETLIREGCNLSMEDHQAL